MSENNLDNNSNDRKEALKSQVKEIGVNTAISTAEYVLDCLEEFFDNMQDPNARIAFKAFLLSLVFTIVSFICWVMNCFSFIGLDEAITANVVLAIIALSDGVNRSKLLSSVKALKNINFEYQESEVNSDDNE